MAVIILIILLQMVLVLPLKPVESAANIALLGCQDSCGGIAIPYPFGIGDNCFLSNHFNVTCDTSNTGKPTPYLYSRDFLEILNINISLGQARMNTPVSYQCYNTTSGGEDSIFWDISFYVPSIRLNNDKNKLIVTGCNTLAYLRLDNGTYSVGCLSTCDSIDSLNKYGPSCSGIGCCQTAVPKDTYDFSFEFDERYNHSQVENFSRCSYAMVAEDNNFVFDATLLTSNKPVNKSVPVAFDWVIIDDETSTCEHARTKKSSYACKSDPSVCTNYRNGPGYICNCPPGYEGNPYLQEGCQDIDECMSNNPCSKLAKCHNLPGEYRCSCPFGWRNMHNAAHNQCELNLALVTGSCAGIVALSFLGFAMYVVLQRRKFSKVKEEYFQQHGGWILLEKIRSNQNQGFGFTIFTKQQVEQATNKFDSANIIGHGGQGTVYRGTLNDQSVAIKKCKIVDETKRKEFGKEMLILSQINHKNIVKLLGCCLEVEVPMLVYEFIPNDTLFHYIHYKKQGSQISLQNRIRIAHESAEALAYLHTSASPPIFHGDVKSANILLDQNYTAKVSDFGASVLAPTDEAQFVTFVQGTCGYLDPEYMQSCQLTDKSDVYSFGVVLLELLTSRPVIDFEAPEEERGLSSRFLSAMKENKIHELLDDQIICEDDMDLITEVAKLANQCLNMKGDERPTMKEVADKLDRIEKFNQHPWRQGYQYHTEETETLLGEASHQIEIEYTGSFSIEKRAEKSIHAR